MELESPVIPQANAAEEVGKWVINLPRLWEKATIEEWRKLFLTIPDTIYANVKETKSIVAIKPEPPLKPVFQVAISREMSDIHILNEPLTDSSVFLVETGKGRLSTICILHLLSALLVVLAYNTAIVFRLGSRSRLNNKMNCYPFRANALFS